MSPNNRQQSLLQSLDPSQRPAFEAAFEIQNTVLEAQARLLEEISQLVKSQAATLKEQSQVNHQLKSLLKQQARPSSLSDATNKFIAFGEDQQFLIDCKTFHDLSQQRHVIPLLKFSRLHKFSTIGQVQQAIQTFRVVASSSFMHPVPTDATEEEKAKAEQQLAATRAGVAKICNYLSKMTYKPDCSISQVETAFELILIKCFASQVSEVSGTILAPPGLAYGCPFSLEFKIESTIGSHFGE